MDLGLTDCRTSEGRFCGHLAEAYTIGVFIKYILYVKNEQQIIYA